MDVGSLIGLIGAIAAVGGVVIAVAAMVRSNRDSDKRALDEVKTTSYREGYWDGVRDHAAGLVQSVNTQRPGAGR